ncbi:MAG TPA: hypothetical protein VGX76_13160 [Pirellulales bacterium]|nr:hypothetical protein [Pirellulales bacterium]
MHANAPGLSWSWWRIDANEHFAEAINHDRDAAEAFLRRIPYF